MSIWPALDQTLNVEVRRLRRAIKELGGDCLTSCMARQLAVNQQLFHLHHQQTNMLRNFQLQNRQTQEETESPS